MALRVSDRLDIGHVVECVQRGPAFLNEEDPLMQSLDPVQRVRLQERYRLWAETWVLTPLHRVLKNNEGKR